MAYKAITCPQCGAAVTSIPDRGSFFCQYCGSKIEKEKLDINISGNVNVAGMASEKSLLDRAFMFLEDDEYENADKYLERVLDANPKCSKAYLGKLLVSKRYNSISSLIHLYMHQLERNALFQKALRFANDDEYDELMAIKDGNIKQHEIYMRDAQSNIDKAAKQLYDFNSYFAMHKFSQAKYQAMNSLVVILMIIASAGFLFNFLCMFIVSPAFIILIIPFCAAIIALSYWSKSIKGKRAQGEHLEQEQARLKNTLQEKQQWMNEVQRRWNTYD